MSMYKREEEESEANKVGSSVMDGTGIENSENVDLISIHVETLSVCLSLHVCVC